MEPIEPMQAQAESVGLNWDDVKQGLTRLLPILETIAKLTPNKYDDAAVEFLKKIVTSCSGRIRIHFPYQSAHSHRPYTRSNPCYGTT